MRIKQIHDRQHWEQAKVEASTERALGSGIYNMRGEHSGIYIF
jgi:hypothetical protein